MQGMGYVHILVMENTTLYQHPRIEAGHSPKFIIWQVFQVTSFKIGQIIASKRKETIMSKIYKFGQEDHLFIFY